VTHSWRSKVERAEHHLRDFEGRIGPVKDKRAYPVSERLETEDQERIYVFRIDIPEPDDPLLPIIAGDLMFNLRSALDHLATAMVPEAQRTRKTAFPIFRDDIDQLDPLTNKHLHSEARVRWEAITKGFPEGAMPIVKQVQPYRHLREGRNPEYAAMALLGAFQNADKHSRLAFVLHGLKEPIIWFNVGPTRRKVRARLPRLDPDRMLGPGAVVARDPEPLPSHMEMEAEGTLDITIGDGESGAYYSTPDIFESMMTDVRGLLDGLEEYAVHVPPPPVRYVVEP
jgi:hypothetical protein